MLNFISTWLFGSQEETLKAARLSDTATIPTRGSEQAAGYDLYASEKIIIMPGSHGKVNLDLIVKVPSGTYGRIAPRSSLASKIHVGGGVVDADYRGNVKVILYNLSDDIFVVEIGNRIAQLICESIKTPPIEEVTKESFEETTRGQGGFGSTGI